LAYPGHDDRPPALQDVSDVSTGFRDATTEPRAPDAISHEARGDGVVNVEHSYNMIFYL